MLFSSDPAHGRVVKAHVITDLFEGVMVDDMRGMDHPISGRQVRRGCVIKKDRKRRPVCIPLKPRNLFKERIAGANAY